MQDVPRLMTAADCARHIGTTVRALRVYEDNGLLSPQRSAKNWRLYGTRELIRLTEILALKAVGFNLSQIGEMLAGRDSDPDAVLALQQERIAVQRERLEARAKLVSALREKTIRGELLSITDLIELAKEIQMTETPENDIAWKRYEQMRPRVQSKLDPEELEEYAGHFFLDAGSAMEIAVENGRAYLRLTGQPRVEMFAEAPDKFFLKAVPAQISFHRTDEGKLSSLTLHQHGLEIEAEVTDAEGFKKAEEAWNARLARTEARAGSEAALPQIIEDHRAGNPDYEAMTEHLAEIVREQLTTVVDELSRLGAVKSIKFACVDNQGFDVFQVAFDNGTMEFGLSETPDGIYDGLFMRPSATHGAGG